MQQLQPVNISMENKLCDLLRIFKNQKIMSITPVHLRQVSHKSMFLFFSDRKCINLNLGNRYWDGVLDLWGGEVISIWQILRILGTGNIFLLQCTKYSRNWTLNLIYYILHIKFHFYLVKIKCIYKNVNILLYR